MKRGFFISVVTALFLSLVLLCCGSGGGGGNGGGGGGGGGGDNGNGSTSSAFVIEQLPGQLSRVDLSTGLVTVVATGLDWPSYVAITSDGKTAFVTETFGDALCKVNLSNGSITRITENLHSPKGVALSADDETVYVLASDSSYGPTDSLHAVDVSTGIKSLITNALGSAIDIIIEQGGNYALVTLNPSGERSKLARVDLASGIITEIANLRTSVAYGLAMEPDGNSVLVTGSPHGLKRVDLSTGDVTTFPIDILLYPYGVVVEPNGTSALITLYGNHTLIRINLNTYAIETIVGLSQFTILNPVGVAIMPQDVGTLTAEINSLSDVINVYEGESVNFQGTAVGDNPPFTFLWDFDGEAPDSTVEGPGDVTFSTAGTYTVTFTVTDIDGNQASDSVIVQVDLWDVTGTWVGTYSTSLIPSAQVTYTITQSSTDVTGTYSTSTGVGGYGNGTYIGTVEGDVINFTLNQTTPGCTGSFNGTAYVNGNYMEFIFTGSDCDGYHANGQGSAIMQ